MLILTRKEGETIAIGDHIQVTVIEVQDGQVRIGIKAPESIAVHREEIRRRINAASAKHLEVDSLGSAAGFKLPIELGNAER